MPETTVDASAGTTPAEVATVEFFGATFELNQDISEAVLMDFALDATSGEQTDLLEGMAVMLRLAVESIAEKDRRRFRSTFRSNRGTATDLIPVITRIFGVTADLPTGGSSDSSDGPASTPPKSESNSADKVAELFPGRPDKQIAVLRTRSA